MPPEIDSDHATRFRTTVEAFVGEYLARYPTEAASLGFHDYDGLLTDFAPEAVAAWMARVRHYRAALAEIDTVALPDDDRLDHEVLDLALDRELFEWEELAGWRRDPMTYLWQLDLSGYLKRDYAPLEARVTAVAAKLARFPALLEQARANLAPPLSVSHIDVAVDMFNGLVSFVEHDLPAEVEPLGDEHAEIVAALEAATGGALTALEAFIAHLDTTQRASATADFAIGEVLYRRMLWTGERVDVPLDRLLEIGEADLERNSAALAATALAIDADATPAEVIARQSANHPDRKTLVRETRAMIEDLRTWVVEHGVVDLPSASPIFVEETPSFMRWAFAMMDAPGAFEDEADEAFYYVTPPEADWPQAQQEEWLTKFDYATLRDVSIHEAYPGHYLHFLHYRNTPGKVRRIFGAYSFWEAWAHYVEQMMIEVGYRPDDLALRLAQLSEALLRDVRFIVSIAMHTRGMTVDEATEMFRTRAHMAEKPARQEAVRGAFDPGYLNYTLGKLMLLKLRRDLRARAKEGGEPFSLRAFHDRFLGFGAPPVPLVRREMLGGQMGDIL